MQSIIILLARYQRTKGKKIINAFAWDRACCWPWPRTHTQLHHLVRGVDVRSLFQQCASSLSVRKKSTWPSALPKSAFRSADVYLLFYSHISCVFLQVTCTFMHVRVNVNACTEKRLMLLAECTRKVSVSHSGSHIYVLLDAFLHS